MPPSSRSAGAIQNPHNVPGLGVDLDDVIPVNPRMAAPGAAGAPAVHHRGSRRVHGSNLRAGSLFFLVGDVPHAGALRQLLPLGILLHLTQ